MRVCAPVLCLIPKASVVFGPQHSRQPMLTTNAAQNESSDMSISCRCAVPHQVEGTGAQEGKAQS
jgi:hypothetical protein